PRQPPAHGGGRPRGGARRPDRLPSAGRGHDRRPRGEPRRVPAAYRTDPPGACAHALDRPPPARRRALRRPDGRTMAVAPDAACLAPLVRASRPGPVLHLDERSARGLHGVPAAGGTGRGARPPRRRHGARSVTPELLVPDWPAPAWVRALSSTRRGGVSTGPWGVADGGPGGLNVGLACGDDPAAVAENRARLRVLLPSRPAWLRQVHGSEVLHVDALPPAGEPPPVADAAVTTVPGRVLAIQTADCLPVLFADRRRRIVG